MKPSLYDLLHQCTVRISVLGKQGHGTGFFVAPGLILTCAHVINTHSEQNIIEVLWDNQLYRAQVTQFLPELDIALLSSSLPEHPCACLREEVEPFGKLYSYGYTDTYPLGEPSSFLLEGVDGRRGKLLKLKTGQVRPGLSGAPLLNIKTGCVCGMIQKSRDRESDLGGRAISIGAVLAALPELEHYQQSHDELHGQWTQLLKTSADSHPPTGEQQNQEKKSIPHPHQNLLRLFRQEYNQRHAQSLQKIPEISLRLHQRFKETHSSAQRVFRRTRSAEEIPFPPGTSIVDAYDHLSNGMLLLGEPGTGKTTLLLELATALLKRAEHDQTHPIPVILSLSSWGKKQQPLDAWIIDELELAYGIPRSSGKKYIEQNQLLLLLDEFDAVACNEPDDIARKVRSACIQAINTYRRSHFVPLVVCSREQEYLNVKKRLALSGTVAVQPLQTQEVIEYLERQGKLMEAICTALQTNTTLQSLITTPFMLSVLLLTYKGRTEDFIYHASIEEQKRQILKHYVQRALDRQPEKVFSPSKTVHFLTFLAQQMKQHQRTGFYLEQLQAEWLPSQRAQNRFHSWSGMFLVLFLGISSTLVAFFMPFLDNKLAGIVDIELAGVTAYYGVITGKLLPNISSGKSWDIEPVERLAWSWKDSLVGLSWIMGGVAVALDVAHGASGHSGSIADLLATGWLHVVMAGLLAGLIGVLLNGLTGTPVHERTRIRPNQGIDDSGVKSLFSGIIMIFGAILFNWLIGGQSIDLLAGLLLGLPTGLTVGIRYGGLSYFRHYLLRFLLWRKRLLPWCFVLFLNECSNSMLLQRVGGGYSFIHPFFLEYFAAFSPETILEPVQPISLQDQAHRARLLSHVRTTWIEPMLERSLHQTARIALGLQGSADVLENPWNLVVQETEAARQILPAGTTIEQVYNEAHGGLLILGEAGSGKTTLLLELARSLTSCAEQDENAALPAIFHLSTWSRKQKKGQEGLPLASWLIQELKDTYEIPKVVAETWLADGKLVLLLDGLDQVAKEMQADCVRAINTYYLQFPEGGRPSLVICSRKKEYLKLPVHLCLPQAVSIQPLSSKQIERYLQSTGKQLKGLQQALRENQELYKLLRLPLMLSIFTLAFKEVAATGLSKKKSSEELIQHAFAMYVDRMLTLGGPLRTTATREDFIRLLSHIAGRMQRRHHTVFSLFLNMSINITWLEGFREYFLYKFFLMLYYVLASGPIFFLWFGPDRGLLYTLTSAIGGFLGWQIGVLIGIGIIMLQGPYTALPVYVIVQILVFVLGTWMSSLAVRLALWCFHRLPLKLASLLNEAEERLFMYKVGKEEYMFTNRLLQDYFASLDGPQNLQDTYTVRLPFWAKSLATHLQRQRD